LAGDKRGKRQTIRPAGPLISDNSEAVLVAAEEGAGIAFIPDWLAGPTLRMGRLVEVLPGRRPRHSAAWAVDTGEDEAFRGRDHNIDQGRLGRL
jgi:DNA-binding transcriptional LysR family regulator